MGASQMDLRTVIEILRADVIVGEYILEDIRVEWCYSADLMSDVLAQPRPYGLLLTGLTNPQVVRTADMVDIKAVCFVRGKQPEADTIALAKQNGILLCATKLGMFDASGILYANGLKGGN